MSDGRRKPHRARSQHSFLVRSSIDMRELDPRARRYARAGLMSTDWEISGRTVLFCRAVKKAFNCGEVLAEVLSSKRSKMAER
jgi:hypothetical protein